MSHTFLCLNYFLKKPHLYFNEQNNKIWQKKSPQNRTGEEKESVCCLETMAREPLARDLCIYVCICILLIAHQTTCFYLPGVAPEDFWKVIPFFLFLQNLFFLSSLGLFMLDQLWIMLVLCFLYPIFFTLLAVDPYFIHFHLPRWWTI